MRSGALTRMTMGIMVDGWSTSLGPEPKPKAKSQEPRVNLIQACLQTDSERDLKVGGRRDLRRGGEAFDSDFRDSGYQDYSIQVRLMPPAHDSAWRGSWH
jgi:hypothetical protein